MTPQEIPDDAGRVSGVAKHDAVPSTGVVGHQEGPTAPEYSAAHQPGRHATRRHPNLLYALVLTCLAAGLLWVWLSKTHVKGGTVMVSAALLIAAVARFMLPADRAGLLASRRRGIDVAVFATLGVALLALALVIPSPS